ncbi:MAG: eukaryotic integral membrane protein-domain-containing protein [Linnemannia elongata]|nr:MAG: eukaryotic integral membrane protein-domain-containing protein [Linnemannia elongata]
MPSAPPSWKATFSNVPPLTKSVSTAMTIMTALGLLIRVRDLLIRTQNGDGDTDTNGNIVVLVPGSEASFLPLVALVPVSAPFRFWTFATASFFERNIIMYVINTFILLGCGKYLERAWGSRELFKYLSITGVGTMLGIYFTCLFEYIVRNNDALLYDTQAYGLTGVVAGFLIGFKQLVPEHLVTVWGVFSIRVKSLPLLFAIVMFLGAFVTHTQIELLMAIYGLFISWIYTRFLKVQDGIRGDRSETFSFASFFPEFIQPPVKVVSNFFFGILVRLHICSPTGYGGSFQYDLENPQMAGMGHTFTQPGSLRAEAERRRALALKALDMRLHAASGGGLSALSSIGRSNTAGRDGASGNVPRVSLLSLSAEPLPTGGSDSDDENEVLFETSALDVNSKSEVSSEAPARTKRSSDGVEDEKEEQ